MCQVREFGELPSCDWCLVRGERSLGCWAGTDLGVRSQSHAEAFGLYAEAGAGCCSAFSWAVSWWDLLVFWKELACSPVRWLEALGLAGRLARRGVTRHWAGGGEEAAQKVRISEPQGRVANKPYYLPSALPRASQNIS